MLAYLESLHWGYRFIHLLVFFILLSDCLVIPAIRFLVKSPQGARK
jgi:hypothetical protein